VDIEEFGKAKEEWFRTFFQLPNGIPSHDTFGRVSARLELEPFERCFMAWAEGLREGVESRLIALGDKILRRSHDHAQGKGALHVVSGWATEHRLVLGQHKVAGHYNEIKAIPQLLSDLEGAIVTIDAMGTQKEIARQVTDAGADYLLALKANQGRLYEEVQECFALEETVGFAGTEHDHHETVLGIGCGF